MYGKCNTGACLLVGGADLNCRTVLSSSAFLHITYIFIYTVFQKKTSTRIIGCKLRNSCPILIIFDTKIPHII